MRIDDFEGNQLRIDEALKERQLGEDRIGDTKTDESDSYVPVPPDLSREIAEWIAAHPQRDNPRAFLFLNRRGTAFSVGNYLKKQLKPLAQSVGILDLTQQAFRRTSSTPSGVTSKPASRGHLKTGQLSASRTALVLPYR